MYMNAIPRKMIVCYTYPSFRQTNLLQKFPYYVEESTEKKKTPSFQGERVEYFQMQSVQSPISI